MENEALFSVAGVLPPGYQARILTETDIPAALALCEGNPLYYEYCPPRPSAENLLADMSALPPGRTMEDKHFLGLWRDEKLAALLDLVLGYPEEDAAWIGLFMTARESQGRGEGSALIGAVLRRLKELGYTRVGLAYAKGNPQSAAFWRKNGFHPTGREVPAEGYTAVVLERELK